METQSDSNSMVDVNLLKKGNVFEVIVDGENHHPVVLMEDFQMGQERIHAVGFSHDDNHNILFPAKYVVDPDDINGYSFRWEKNKRGQTSIIPLGFEKKIVYLHEFIGRINNKGIAFIHKHISKFEECDVTIQEFVKKHPEYIVKAK